jgi:hypothetical protein
MTTITIEITDEEMAALRERADSLGVAPEDWIRSSIVARLGLPLDEERRSRTIEALTSRLLEDRAEVYRALAEGAP